MQQNLAIPNALDSPHTNKHQTSNQLKTNSTVNEAHQKAQAHKPVAAMQMQQGAHITTQPNQMYLQATNTNTISPAMSETPPLVMYPQKTAMNNNEKVPFSITPDIIQNPNTRPTMPLMKPVIKTPAVSQPRVVPNKSAAKINIPDAVASIVDGWEADMKKEIKRRPSGHYDTGKKNFFNNFF